MHVCAYVYPILQFMCTYLTAGLGLPPLLLVGVVSLCDGEGVPALLLFLLPLLQLQLIAQHLTLIHYLCSSGCGHIVTTEITTNRFIV